MRGISVVLTTVLLVMIAASLVLSYFFWAQGEANVLFSKGSEDVSRALASPPSIAHAFGVYDANTGVTDLTVVFRVEQPFDENVTLAIYSLDDVVVYSGIWHVSCGADPCTQHAYLDLSPGIYTLQVSTAAGTSRYAKYFRVTEYVSPVADVYVANMFAPTTATVGDFVDVNVSICSQNANEVAETNVIFYRNMEYINNHLKDVPPGSCTTVSQQILVEYGENNVFVRVDVLNTPDENPNNNTGQTTIVGEEHYDAYFASGVMYPLIIQDSDVLFFGEYNSVRVDLNICNSGPTGGHITITPTAERNVSVQGTSIYLSPNTCAIVSLDGNTTDWGTAELNLMLSDDENTQNNTIHLDANIHYAYTCNDCASCSEKILAASAFVNEYSITAHVLQMSDLSAIDSNCIVVSDINTPAGVLHFSEDYSSNPVVIYEGLAHSISISGNSISAIQCSTCKDIWIRDVNISVEGNHSKGVWFTGVSVYKFSDSNIWLSGDYSKGFVVSDSSDAWGNLVNLGIFGAGLHIQGASIVYITNHASTTYIDGMIIRLRGDYASGVEGHMNVYLTGVDVNVSGDFARGIMNVTQINSGAVRVSGNQVVGASNFRFSPGGDKNIYAEGNGAIGAYFYHPNYTHIPFSKVTIVAEGNYAKAMYLTDDPWEARTTFVLDGGQWNLRACGHGARAVDVDSNTVIELRGATLSAHSCAGYSLYLSDKAAISSCKGVTGSYGDSTIEYTEPAAIYGENNCESEHMQPVSSCDSSLCGNPGVPYAYFECNDCNSCSSAVSAARAVMLENGVGATIKLSNGFDENLSSPWNELKYCIGGAVSVPSGRTFIFDGLNRELNVREGGVFDINCTGDGNCIIQNLGAFADIQVNYGLGPLWIYANRVYGQWVSRNVKLCGTLSANPGVSGAVVLVGGNSTLFFDLSERNSAICPDAGTRMKYYVYLKDSHSLLTCDCDGSGNHLYVLGEDKGNGRVTCNCLVNTNTFAECRSS